jgi:molybdopterin-guanine dinucleotide biosynthesis protein
MHALVVGGHTRNIGKTALVVDIIRAFPEAAWTAIKITQHGHGVCSINGKECDCAPQDHSFALDEECDRSDRTDTSRFLVAGAVRSLWVRTRQGCLGDFAPHLLGELRTASNVIIESNSVLEFIQPELYLVVLDPTKADFKESAQRFLSRADAFVLRAPLQEATWLRADGGPPLIAPGDVEIKPRFDQPLGGELPTGLVQLIRQQFFALAHLSEAGSSNS